jgi:hypothetical protein
VAPNRSLKCCDNNINSEVCTELVQVGPVWPAGGTQQGTKMQMYLSSPANNTIIAPYTVTLTAPAPFSAAYPWEWQATITPEGYVRPTAPLAFPGSCFGFY